MRSIDALKKHRALAIRAVTGIKPEQLVTVPDGFNNNILWNVGHALVTQEILTYKLSGLTPQVSDTLIQQCSRGTSPSNWTETPDVDEILRELEASPKRLATDYADGRFSGYQRYTTSLGVELRDIEEAIAFNNFHEGVHLGVVLALRKLV